MNAYRTIAARLIRRNAGLDNGGYAFPLEFSLRLSAAPKPADVLKVLHQDHPQEAKLALADQAFRGRIARRTSGSLEVAVCNMQMDLLVHPDWRSPMPRVATAWGFAKLLVSVDFDVVGLEGGHHLVVTAFQGVSLRGWSASDLADAIEDGRVGSNQWVRELGCMLQEWTEAFAPDCIQSLVEHHLAIVVAEDIRKAVASRYTQVYSRETLNHLHEGVTVHSTRDNGLDITL